MWYVQQRELICEVDLARDKAVEGERSARPFDTGERDGARTHFRLGLVEAMTALWPELLAMTCLGVCDIGGRGKACPVFLHRASRGRDSQLP